MKYNIFTNKQYQTAMDNLSNAPMSPKIAMRVSKVLEKVGEAEKDFGMRYSTLVNEHAKRNDDDEIIQSETGGIVLADEKKDEFWKSFQEIQDTPIDGIVPFYLSDFGDDVKFTPRDLAALKGLVISD